MAKTAPMRLTGALVPGAVAPAAAQTRGERKTSSAMLRPAAEGMAVPERPPAQVRAAPMTQMDANGIPPVGRHTPEMQSSAAGAGPTRDPNP